MPIPGKIFDGLTFRRLQERSEFSFEAIMSINNVTGVSVFGFSGENNFLKFDFQKGQMVGPEGRSALSYQKDQVFSLSGNYNQGKYNYYINSEPICFSGAVNNFKLQKFFVDCTGCELNLRKFDVHSRGSGNFDISFSGQTLEPKKLMTGLVTHSGSGEAFDFFSGTIHEPLDRAMTIYSLPLGVTGKANIVFSGYSGLQARQTIGPVNQVDVDFYTSFGKLRKELRFSGSTDILGRNLLLTATDESGFIISGETQNIVSGYSFSSNVESGIVRSGSHSLTEKTGQYKVTYEAYKGLTLLSGTVDASLHYVSGYTGVVSGALTGIHVVSEGYEESVLGGSGYYDSPWVRVSGGDGEGATLKILIDSSAGIITGGIVKDGGSGYGSFCLNNDPQPVSFVIRENLTKIRIDNLGSGYQIPPTFMVTGGGVPDFSGGSGIGDYLPTVSNGKLASIPVTVSGKYITGYIPRILLNDPPNIKIYSLVSGGNLQNLNQHYVSKPTLTISGGGGDGYASGEALMDGNITGSDLTNFGFYKTGVSAATFVCSGGFSGGSGLNATGTALVSLGISGINLTHSGTGYSTAPSIIINGISSSGVGAAATSSITSGFISSINITSGGTGYYTGSPPIITLSGGNPDITGSGEPLYGVVVTGIKVSRSGSGYISKPSLTFSKTDSISAASGLGLTGLYVSGIKMTSHGRSYLDVPELSFFGGTGTIGSPILASGQAVMASGASATAILSTGAKIIGCFGDYTKPFTGQWNFFTGSGSNGLWFRESGYHNTNETIYENKLISGRGGLQNINIYAVYKSYYDNESCVVKLKVSGSGDLKEERLITGIK